MNEKFARSGVLFLQYIKRDWKKIGFWVIGLGIFCGSFVPAFEEISKGQGLAGMYETLKNPAMISMVGPTAAKTASDYTLGAMYAHTMLLFCALFAMILTALHVVSHTRKEEELGLTELVRSFQVGRQANSLAVVFEIIVINGLLASVISGMMGAFQVATIDWQGAILFGVSIGGAGILGGLIALVLAQLMPNSSGATGATLGIIGLLYILRAGTDVANDGLSNWNPLGWTYLTYPFTENNWFYLYWLLFGAMVLFLVAFLLENYRDMGVGYLPEREGRAHAKDSLLSIHGFLLRLNRGVMLGWFVGFLTMGVAYGSIYGDMQAFLDSNELMKQMFTQTGTSIEASFTSTIVVVLVMLVAILPIAIINKLFSEETHLRFSQLYVTQVTRAKLFATTVLLAMIASAIGIFLAVGALGGSALYVMNDTSSLNFADFLMAGFNLYPAVCFFIGLAACFLGWFPKFGMFSYIYLSYAFLLDYFGGILDLPEWFAKTGIFKWLPKLPVETFDVGIFASLLGISLLLVLFGFYGYKRRDLLEGA
ncbi:ABC transporter permease [Enterococcus saccharolyticus]|uniref:Tetronasin resistance protein n=1 Tax=Enterococcus saccharolyticus subsp. saccharolyticus ATCC 43076 TaxID=1139996 RepID=S0JHA7_9ENTE|nr:hypothetical protein [Enterococcus saccharolyticus]EOT27925.1 hypothetical protein OMQ_01839 [Enterococcus saccharolyticus subsp. saccharolyticus ATCC 43076]EOT77303.1 hypothetical protein I572_02215 [Enterococcus saccharolyticus subsp. saccharolyticus ATCC 43076]OJG90921.1 hypothetical protein RV16_GL001169 [Enterococcus saccharolyticus]